MDPTSDARSSIDSLSAQTVRPACIVDTEYTPCSVEFCPAEPSLVVCGLYQTQQIKDGLTQDSEAPKTERLGRCILFETTREVQTGMPPAEKTIETPTIKCKELQRIDCPAILDQRWTQDPEPALLISDAEGNLKSYSLRNDWKSAQLDLVNDFSCASNDVLCLALDISDRVTSTANPKVVTSLSNGEIVLLNRNSPTNSLVEETRWHGHDFEPWTCGFDYWQPATILTGGDDCKLKLWDLRKSLHEPTLINKQFEGGVTAIRSHHLREHVFAAGSYDSALRIYDKRNFARPLWKQDVGGGIWRLKWHAEQPEKLLLAAMHDGFKVVDVYEQSSGTAPRIQTIFNERSTLAYGADWGPVWVEKGRSQSLIGSCSFYDRALHFWYINSTLSS